MYKITIKESCGFIRDGKILIRTPCEITVNNTNDIKFQLRLLGVTNYKVVNLLKSNNKVNLKSPIKLGCVKDVIDIRDYKIKTVSLSDVNLQIPSKVSYMNEMSPVKNQKHLGSCVGFAVAAMKEWQEQKEHNKELKEGKKYKRKEKYYNLSEQWIYYKSKEIDPWPNEEGTSIRCAMRQLSKYGVPPEKAWVYNDRYKGKPQFWATMISKWALGGSYYRISSVEELEESLYKFGPVVIGIYCFREIFSVTSNGVVHYPRNTNEIFGGHAICVTGFDRKEKIFTFKNSWGPDWGHYGYGYIHYDYINNFMLDAWVMLDVNVKSVG